MHFLIVSTMRLFQIKYRYFSVVGLLLVSISLPSLFAQQKATFKGTVIDASDGSPLVGANIKLKKDFSTGTVSDYEGRFSIHLDPGNYSFILSFIGMENDTVTFSLKPGEVIEKQIILFPVWKELEEVEVKVGKFDKRVEDITVSMEVIKPRLIENKNTRTIETVLDYAPGLNIMDNEPQIRGGSGFTFGVGSKVAILIDDMPMISGDAGRPYWDLIPVENIAHIEVIKGASSVLSGTSALSGAIHIMTASPNTKPVTKITAYTGFYSSPGDESMKWWDDYPYVAGLSFLHSKKYGLVDVVLGGNVDFDHGYIGAPRPGSLVIDTISDFTDKQMQSQKYRFNFNIKKHSKKYQGLNFGMNGNFMWYSGPMVLAWLDDTAGFYRAYPGAVYLQDQFIFYLDPFLNIFSGEGMKHSIKARILHNNSGMTNNQSVVNTLLFGDYQFKRTYDFLQGFELIGGVSVNQTYVDAEIYRASGSTFNKQFNVSAYAQVENKYKGIVNISIGARGEYYQLNDSITALKPIVRAGVNFKVYPGTFLRLSFGQGYRFPSITERYIKTSAGSFAVFDNPDLKSESSWNTEIGLKQGFKFKNYFGYLDIAGFIQEYNNTIEYLFGFWEPSFALAGFKFLNTGRSRVMGIDISQTGSTKLGSKTGIRMMAGYSYIMPKTMDPDFIYARDALNREFNYDTTSLNPEKHILKYRFLHTIKADFEFYSKKLSLGYSIKYFSKIENLDLAIADFERATAIETTGGTMQPIVYMDYFNNHNHGNIIMDGRISYEFFKRHKVSLICNNLLNRTYSLRPLKAEEVRSIMLQYVLNI
ncbi:MAG: TonB-dependent receptor [Bacteroidales bacterium]|nr:TonB-dependent receptor [Bacteroidales bacterium]